MKGVGQATVSFSKRALNMEFKPYSERLSGGERVKISSPHVHTKDCAKEANSKCSFINECSKRIMCRGEKRTHFRSKESPSRKFNNEIKVTDHDNFVSFHVSAAQP